MRHERSTRVMPSVMQSDVRGVPATVGLPTMMPLVMLHARRFLCSAGRESG